MSDLLGMIAIATAGIAGASLIVWFNACGMFPGITYRQMWRLTLWGRR